jgi:cell division protein FtsQ
VKRVVLKPATLSALALTLALAYLLGWSQIFTVKTIQVVGSPNTISEGDILKLSQVKIGQQLARINTRATEKRVSEITWVQEAQISRNWINGEVVLEVTVRQPIAYFNTDQIKGQTIDSNGEPFILPGFSGSDLPIISSASPEGALAASDLFTRFPNDFRGSITSMAAKTSSSFVLNTRHNGRDLTIRWGDSSEINLKIAVIKRLLTEPENKKISFIDLLAPYAPIVG